MPYFVFPSPNGTYIVQKFVGSINRQLAIKSIAESHRLGKKIGISRFLVDATQARNSDSVMDNYDFAYSDVQAISVMDKTARIAILVAPDDRSHEFVALALKNAGIDVAVFKEMGLAIEFLMAV